jgi:hypothetical protein
VWLDMSGSMTRRGVLTGAAAIAGVTVLPQFLMPPPGELPAIGHVVVDERVTHPLALASGLAEHRIHTVNALDDLCNRWYTGLRRQVLADAGHIAGLTTWMDFVVMRDCAAEIGYIKGRDSWALAMSQALATISAASPGHVRLISWVFSPRSN